MLIDCIHSYSYWNIYQVDKIINGKLEVYDLSFNLGIIE